LRQTFSQKKVLFKKLCTRDPRASLNMFSKKILFAAVFAGFSFLIVTIRFGLHVVNEGHIGVYYRGGALLDTYTEPGLHWKMPYITTYEEVQVTIQTDSVRNIPCGTSEGTMIYFDKVEVVNQLSKKSAVNLIRNYTVNYDQTWIFDKVHHEINQFCSKHTLQEVYIELFDTLDEAIADALQASVDKWAPGLQIIAVRVTKPKIPSEVKKTYEHMAQQSAELRKAQMEKKVILQRATTEKEKQKIKQEQERELEEIKLLMNIKKKETEAKIAKINDEIAFNKRKRATDSKAYEEVKQAEANKMKLTPEFLEFTRLTALKENTKFYFGEKLPNFLPSDIMGSVTAISSHHQHAEVLEGTEETCTKDA